MGRRQSTVSMRLLIKENIRMAPKHIRLNFLGLSLEAFHFYDLLKKNIKAQELMILGLLPQKAVLAVEI